MRRKGFVVSAMLYPLLLLFLALILGLISMNTTRKRVLDHMKEEIGEDLFDRDTCDCKSIIFSIEEYKEKLNGFEKEIEEKLK